jgi:hypothetical protein
VVAILVEHEPFARSTLQGEIKIMTRAGLER